MNNRKRSDKLKRASQQSLADSTSATPKKKTKIDMSELKTTTKIGVITSVSAVAILGVSIVLMSLKEDSKEDYANEVDSGYHQSNSYYNEGDEGYDSESSLDGEFGSSYEGILGVEAEYKPEQTEDEDLYVLPKPWFHVSSEELNQSSVARQVRKSYKGQVTRENIIKLINKKAVQDAVKATNANTQNSETDNLIQSVINGMNIPTTGISSSDWGDLTIPVKQPTSSDVVVVPPTKGNDNKPATTNDDSLSDKEVDNYYKDLYDKLVTGIVDSGLGSISVGDGDVNVSKGNGSSNSAVEEESSIDELTPTKPQVDTSKDKEVDKSLSMVTIGSKEQFEPLSKFESKFYLKTTKEEGIKEYLQKLNRSYKGQLDVGEIYYEASSSDLSLYLIKVDYLMTKSQIDSITSHAKNFANTNKNLTDDEFLKSLADHIANLARYGNSSNKYSAYSLFKGDAVVCQAYASFAKFMMDARGLDNTLLTGASNGEPHVWNVVKLNGLEYEYDFTHYDTSNKDKVFLKAKPGLLPNRSYQFIVE